MVHEQAGLPFSRDLKSFAVYVSLNVNHLIYKMIASLGGDAKPGLVSFILSYK